MFVKLISFDLSNDALMLSEILKIRHIPNIINETKAVIQKMRRIIFGKRNFINNHTKVPGKGNILYPLDTYKSLPTHRLRLHLQHLKTCRT